MTLEEMQHTWSEMTQRIEHQEHLTHALIMEITQQKFRHRINSISKIEGTAAMVCFALALAVLLTLNRLDTWYLLTSGIIIAAYLIIAPTLVMYSIRRMKTININNATFKQSITEFTKRKSQFLFLQRLFICLNLILVVLVMPVAKKVFSGEDMFIQDPSAWYWSVGLLLAFMIPFSIWGYRGYKRMTASAQKLLLDLE